MITKSGLDPVKPTTTSPAPDGLPRRSFLRYSGAAVALTGLLLTTGCDDDEDTIEDAIDVGSGDTGVLNYAYALEQLEAAFYAAVKNGDYYKAPSTSAAEKQIIDDLALHEQAHVDFFKAALGNNALAKALEPDFSAINFNDRTSVLTNAQAFEDLGVAAYNGAGRYITSAANLVIAGKIVSVEARHAALIRDLRQYNTFVASDVVDVFSPTSGSTTIGEGSGTGMERSKTPTEVLAIANQFLRAGSKISANNLR